MLERHDRNRDFAWTPLTGPFRRISGVQAAQYDSDGYFLLKSAFTQEEVRAVADAIEPFERRTEEFLRIHAGGKLMIAKADAITFTVHIAAKSEALRAFSVHPVFRDLCADLIGRRARLYWDQAVYKKPGNAVAFPPGTDDGVPQNDPERQYWVGL